MCFLKNDKRKIYLQYSLVFFVTSIFVFLPFYILNKGFFRYDGICQHLPAMMYLGEYFRTIVKTFFTSGQIVIPQWDFSIGFGADILKTLHYYGLGDPFLIFSAFVPAEYTSVLYHVLVFLRLYAAGLTFVVYFKHHSFNTYEVVCGAIVYVFCGFSFFCAPRHPFFINPMIYLPLLCLGIDLILENKKPFCFILSAFLACISSFYFFYMLSVLIFIYAIVRFFFVYENKSLAFFIKKFFLTAFYYLVAVFMASAIFIPNVMGFMESSRISESGDVPVLYSISYYVKMLCSIVAPTQSFSYTELGYAAVVLPFVVLCIQKRDKISAQLKIFLLIAAIFLTFPFFGHIFNGFNYVTNRWSFAVSFIVAGVVVYVASEIESFSDKNWIFAIIPSICFSLILIVGSVFSAKIRNHYFVSYLVLMFFSIGIFLVRLKIPVHIKKILLPCICFSVICNAFVKYMPEQLDYLNDFYLSDSAKKLLHESVDKKFEKTVSDNSFFRINEKNKFILNDQILCNINGTSYYWSMNDSVLQTFYEEIGLINSNSMHTKELNNRTTLMDLFSIKYMYEPVNSCVPYDSVFLQNIDTFSKNYSVFVRNNTLPLCFAYDKALSYESIKELSPLKKQEICLDYALIESENSVQANLIKDSFDFISTVDYKLSMNEDVKISDGKIFVKKDGASIHFNFDSIKNKELYLFLDSIYFISDKTENALFVLTDNTGNIINFTVGKKTDYFGHKPLVCTSYSDKDVNTFTLSFQKKGIYQIKSFYLYQLSLENHKKRIEQLKLFDLNDYSIKPNRVSASVNMPSKKFLCFSIPYSKGWKAFIDGKKVDILKANYMFCGLEVNEGVHNIEFIYRTPYFTFAFAVTLLGIILFIGVIIYERKS